MKKNALKELLGKSTKELHSMVDSLRFEMTKLTVEKNTGKEKNTAIVSNKRHDVAQILTILKDKEQKVS